MENMDNVNKSENNNNKLKGLAIGVGVVILIVTAYVVGKQSLDKKESMRNNTEISNIDFNMLKTVVANIPPVGDGPGFIVRTGFKESYKLAFNDYTNNNIYEFKGYNLLSAYNDIVLNSDVGALYVLNREGESLDYIDISKFKPEIAKQTVIKDVESIIGSDLEQGVIFCVTKSKELIGYDMNKNERFEYLKEGKRFNEIYKEIDELYGISDYLYIENFKLPTGEIAGGIYIAYIKDGEMEHTFYKYIKDTRAFEEVKLEG